MSDYWLDDQKGLPIMIKEALAFCNTLVWAVGLQINMFTHMLITRPLLVHGRNSQMI